jgi:hypothetical protein
VLACQGVTDKFSPKKPTDFLAYELAIMSWYESRRSALSPNLLTFLSIRRNSKNPEETLDSAGGDTLWIKILEKLNYYVRKNPGAMSAL